MYRRLLAATGAALALTAAVGAAPAAAQTQLQTVPTQSPASPSSIPPADLDFVLKSAMGGMEEVALGDLAAQKAESQQVKDLAVLIAREHRMANEELLQVAAKKGIDIPKTTSPVAQAVAASMSELNGQKFDMQYVMQQHGAHLAAVASFRNATQHAMDPDVKAFAQKYAPKIEAHTAQIEKVAQAMMQQGAGKTQ